MQAYTQPKPNSESLGYKPTEFDDLSPEELDKLINATGRVRVAPATAPKQKRVVDLSFLGGPFSHV